MNNNEPISSSLFDGLAPVEPTPIATVEPTITPEPTPLSVETPPVVEVTPTPEPTPQPVFDTKAIFGEKYNSVEDVKSVWDNLHKEVEQLRSKEPEFANDDIKFLNTAIKAGIPADQVDIIKAVQAGTLTDPKDVVAAQLRMQYGWSKDKVDLYMDKTYKLGEDYDAEDSDVQLARMQLDMSAEIAKNYLTEKASSVKVPQSVPVEQIIQQQVEQWTPIIPDVVNKSATVKIADGLEYQVPKETIDAVQDYVKGVVGYDVWDSKDPNVIKEMEAIAQKEVVFREFNNIVKYMNVEMEKKAIREKANVPPNPGQQTPPSGSTEIDNTRNILKQMAAELGK